MAAQDLVTHLLDSADPDDFDPQAYLHAVPTRWVVYLSDPVWKQDVNPDLHLMDFLAIDEHGRFYFNDDFKHAYLFLSKQAAERGLRNYLANRTDPYIEAYADDFYGVTEVSRFLRESADPDAIDPQRYLDAVHAKWAVVYTRPGDHAVYYQIEPYGEGGFGDFVQTSPVSARIHSSKESAEQARKAFLDYFADDPHALPADQISVQEISGLIDAENERVRRYRAELDAMDESADPDAIDPQRYLDQVPAGYIISWTNKEGVEWVWQRYGSFGGGSGARVNAHIFPSRQAAQDMLTHRGLEGYSILPYTPRIRDVDESADPDDPQALLSRMRGRWAVTTTVAGRPYYAKVITLTDRQRAKRVQMGKPDYRWLYDWVLDIKLASLFTSKDAAEAVLGRMQSANETAGKYRSVQEVSSLLHESVDPDEIADPHHYIAGAVEPLEQITTKEIRKLLRGMGFKVTYARKTKRFPGISLYVQDQTGRSLDWQDEKLVSNAIHEWLKKRLGNKPGTIRGYEYAHDYQINVWAWDGMETDVATGVPRRVRKPGLSIDIYKPPSGDAPHATHYLESADPDAISPQQYLDAVTIPHKVGTFVTSKRLFHHYGSSAPKSGEIFSIVGLGRPGHPGFEDKPSYYVKFYQHPGLNGNYKHDDLVPLEPQFQPGWMGEAADPDDVNPSEYLDDVAPSLEHLMQQHGFELGHNTDRYYKSYPLADGRYFIVSAEDNGMQPKSSEPDAPVVQTYWVQVRTRDCPHDSFRNMNWTELAFAQADDDSLTGLVEFAEEMGQVCSEHPGEVTDSEMQSLFVDAGWDYTVRLGESLADPDDPDAFFKRHTAFQPKPHGEFRGNSSREATTKWTSLGNPAVVYSSDTHRYGTCFLSASDSGAAANATVDQLKQAFASVIRALDLKKVNFTVFQVDRDIDAIYGLEEDGVIETTGQNGMIVYAIVEEHDAVTESLLDDFVRLNLKSAPRFQVEQNVPCNDVDRIGGPQEFLPVAVVSYDTMQKYIVPRGDGYLVPVPVGNNWSIHKLSEAQLKQVVATLSANPDATLADFYALAQQTGAFWRNYYESAEPVMEMGGAVNIWLSPAGKPYYCADHAEWAASEVLKKPLSKMTGTYWEARGFVYRQMFRRGWARLAIPHTQKKLMVDSHRTTPAQWEWIYDKGWEDRLQIVDDQEQTIIDYREGSGVEPPKGEETGTWESLQVADPDDFDADHYIASTVDPEVLLPKAGFASRQKDEGTGVVYWLRYLPDGTALGVTLYPDGSAHYRHVRNSTASAGRKFNPNRAFQVLDMHVGDFQAIHQKLLDFPLNESVDPDDPDQNMRRALDASSPHALAVRLAEAGYALQGMQGGSDEQFYTKAIKRGVRVSVFLSEAFVKNGSVEGYAENQSDWGVAVTLNVARSTMGVVYPQPFRLMEAVAEMETLAHTVRGIDLEHETEQRLDAAIREIRRRYMGDLAESADPDDPDQFIQKMPVPRYIVRGRDAAHHDWRYVNRGLFLTTDPSRATHYSVSSAQQVVDRFKSRVGEIEIVPVQESVDPDSPERYVQSAGTDFGAWLEIQGLKKVSDAVVDEYQTEGYMEGAPRSLRVVHFKDGVDYRSNPRGPWLWLLLGTNKQEEGEEAEIRPAVERFLQRLRPTDDYTGDEDVPVEEAMVEVLLTEADPDEFDPELYLHQTTSAREAMRMVGMSSVGKAWPKDTLNRVFKRYPLNPPVPYNRGSVKEPSMTAMEAVTVYDFGGRATVRGGIEMAAGILFSDGAHAPQVSMDIDPENMTAGLARVIHHLDKFFARYSTTGKDWEMVLRDVVTELGEARRAQHGRRVREAIEPFKQPDEVTCGSSVVYMLSRSMGKLNADFQQVCQMCRTNRLWGTLPMFMSSALRKLGIAHTKTKVTSAAQLDGIYALLTVYEHLPHWILVTGQLDGQFTVNDPAQGAVVYNAEQVDSLLDKSQLSGVYKMVGFMIGTAFRIECPVQESADPDDPATFMKRYDWMGDLAAMGAKLEPYTDWQAGLYSGAGVWVKKWDEAMGFKVILAAIPDEDDAHLHYTRRYYSSQEMSLWWRFEPERVVEIFRQLSDAADAVVAGRLHTQDLDALALKLYRPMQKQWNESADPDDPDAFLKNYHPMELIVKAQMPDGPRYITRHSWEGTFKTKAAVERWLTEPAIRGHTIVDYLERPNRVVLEEWVVPTHKLDAYLEKAWQWIGGMFIDITAKYPCPFCGGEPEPVDSDAVHFRYCTRCERTWFLGKPERFGMDEAVDPDEPTPENIVRLGRQGDCNEPCEICGKLCTLIHYPSRLINHPTKSGSKNVMVPSYHLCQDCDTGLKSGLKGRIGAPRPA